MGLNIGQPYAETTSMEGVRRSGRRMRRSFGVLAGLTAAADLTVAMATPTNRYRIPTVDAASRPFVVGYGAFLVVVALWAIATSFRGGQPKAKAEAEAKAKPDRKKASHPVPAAPPVAIPERAAVTNPAVIHHLRSHGWFVADNVRLPHADIDHVAVGPAGVLAVQVMQTDVPDPRGKPGARTRIAAQQLRELLAQKEIDVEVVAALVAWGPGLDPVPGGVKVIDNVAILLGEQADDWLAELSRRDLLADDTVNAVRFVLSDILEGVPAEMAGARPFESAAV